jgi:hypothetical protein
MKVIPPSSAEISWRQTSRFIMMNPLMMSQYYTNLFTAFKSLMMIMGDEDNFKQLEKMVKDVENWISDDLNPLTLAEAELRMWNNMDLLSGFEVNGQMITQMEINSKLEKIKQFLIQLHFEYSRFIRWTIALRDI